MKKTLKTLLFTAAVVGAFGINGAVLADSNATAADTTDNKQVGATTNGSLNFKGGTLSLYNVQDTATFNDTTSAFSTQDVFTKGLQATKADKQMTATVDDFLGGENDTWNLTVSKGQWAAGTDGVASGATALNTGAHLSVGDEITTDGIQFGTGSEGHNVLKAKDLTVAIDPGTLVKKGTYTNTLTWNLAESAAKNQD